MKPAPPVTSTCFPFIVRSDEAISTFLAPLQYSDDTGMFLQPPHPYTSSLYPSVIYYKKTYKSYSLFNDAALQPMGLLERNLLAFTLAMF